MGSWRNGGNCYHNDICLTATAAFVKLALGRRGAVIAGAVWTAFCTAEYWVLGPFSALGRPDEYHATIPWLYFLTHAHVGGAYAHGFAGGVDAAVGLATGSQYLSIEKLAFSVLPLWGSVLLMKAGAIALAFAGGYKLARGGIGLARGDALVVALVASGAHLYNFAYVLGGLGWGTALLPWAFYLLCVRSDRRRFYGPVALLALAYSGSTNPVHSTPALVFACLLSCALLPPARIWRTAMGALLFGLVCLVNWSAMLAAVLQLSSESARVTVRPAGLGIYEALTANHDVLTPITVVALALLAAQRDRIVWRALPVVILAISLGPVLSWLDWSTTGIAALATYRWSLLSDGFILPALIVLARALAALRAPPAIHFAARWWPPLAASYFAAVAVLFASYEKSLNLVDYRFYGGQALVNRVAALGDCGWRPAEPFRVVTVASLFSPATAAAYGLDTLDGVASQFPIRSGLFFGLAVTKPPNPRQNVQYHWINVPPGAASMSATVELDALRIANVRYVLSDRRLEDAKLTLLANECARSPLRPADKAFGEWLSRWAPKAMVRELYIYELADPWPRVFAPAEVRTSPAAIDSEQFYRELLAASRRRIALISQVDAGPLAGTELSGDAYVLTGAHVVPGGFDLSVARRAGSRALAGLIVVNAPYSRFWRAEWGAKELTIVPVNGVHMGVVVAGHGGSIRLRYERPTLAQAVSRLR